MEAGASEAVSPASPEAVGGGVDSSSSARREALGFLKPWAVAAAHRSSAEKRCSFISAAVARNPHWILEF